MKLDSDGLTPLMRVCIYGHEKEDNASLCKKRLRCAKVLSGEKDPFYLVFTKD